MKKQKNESGEDIKEDSKIAVKEDGKTTSKGEETNLNKQSVYRVKYDKEKKDWVVKKDGAKRATRRFDTKEEAMKFTKNLMKEKSAVVSVHKKNGQFQKK